MKNEFKTKYGTVKIGAHGYYKVTSHKEGNAMKLWHRLIWEDFYGCEIPKGYHVHHKNGNKLDNCILNLQLLNEKEHVRLHHKGEKSHNWKSHARIVKHGIKNGKQSYDIKKDGKTIKQSIYPYKLLDWFTKEYPKEILQIKINISDDW